MSGSNLLVDTNFLIYLLNGHKAVVPYLNNNFFISEVTEMEMLGVKSLPASALKTRKQLIENCFIVNFNSDIKEIAIRIKQKITIKLPDAIVAASAMCMGLPLVTGDRGFLKIDGLELQLLKL
jgi:hypothetical protein